MKQIIKDKIKQIKVATNTRESKKVFSGFSLKANSQQLKASSGFTVLFASLIGALVLSIGLAILNITLKQGILSSAGRKTQQSFYAADSGVECALYIDRGAGNSDCKLGYFRSPSTTPDGGTVTTVCGEDSAISSVLNSVHECFGKNFVISRSSDLSGDKVVDQLEISGDPSTFVSGRNVDMAGTPVDNADMCFIVDVIKGLVVDPATGEKTLSTKFESRGYNTCSDVGGEKFERAIRVENN